MYRVKDIINLLEDIAPLSLAESWDNVGLLLGDENEQVARVITCLTITPEVVDEAIRGNVRMIITHHPLLFKAVQKITSNTSEGRMLLALMASSIAVYSAHTAYDNAQGGINEQLARGLFLQEIVPLIRKPVEPRFKIVVFTPESDLSAVSNAAFSAGAGVIGQYEQCSYRSSGVGTFFGREGTHPTLGSAGQREEVSELRLEIVCTSSCLGQTLSAIRQSHSYEEPAIDVYPLHALLAQASDPSLGTGRMGRMTQPVSAQTLAERVAQLLGTPVTLTGHHQHSSIETVAIVCGAGGSLMPQAISAGVDAFLTGEIRFHDELAAQAAGVCVIAAGHYATERFGMETLAHRLAEALPGTEVWASHAEHNPARWIATRTIPSSD